MAPQDRKAEILDATEALLLEVGNAGLTMRGVASRAGISLGNLQYHFASREALLLALLLRFLAPYEAGLETRPAAGPGDLTAALKDQFLAFLTQPDFDRYSVMFRELWAAANHSPDIGAALDAYYARLVAFYRTILIASGAHPARADSAVLVLLPLLEGYCVTRAAIDRPVRELAADWAGALASILGDEG